MNTSSSVEDRIWAILSHLSSLAFGMGIVLPIIGWSDQRRKSNYATFQNLQALGYQSLGFTVWILSYLMITILGLIILLAASGSGGIDSIARPWVIVFVIVIFGFFALYILLPIIAAVACALGRDFRYPIMGNRLARYLEYDPTGKSEEQIWLNEDHEYRWVAATGHFSILILIWGMLAPLTTWTLYGKRSDFLKFQSIQTLVYQAGATILFFGGAFLYATGLLLFIAATGGFGGPNFNVATGIAGMLILGAVLLISIVVLLLVPLMHILGQWAGYRVLKGDDYHYPFVGRLVHKWISKNSIDEEKPA